VLDGVATVDLSSEFGSGSGSFAEIARLEQLVYTLTRFPEIDGIRLQLDGVPVEVFGGHGIVLDDPVVRTDLDTTLPAILIESPPYPGSLDPASGEMGEWANPLQVSGTANVFEATISAALTDADGLIIWEGFTTATCGTGCRGTWTLTIPYEVDVAQRGSLIVWEASARDGSQTNVREHPVWLVPGAGSTPSAASPDAECSASLVADPLSPQPALPEVVAEMRAAVFAAASNCDWGELGSLLSPDGFRFSFGGDADAIARWQQLEADGFGPMRFLAELLNRPFAEQDLGEVTYYWWPSAFVTGWDEVPPADREALRPLFDDADFAGFADFGAYIGYRVGITGAGEWVVFVAGD